MTYNHTEECRMRIILSLAWQETQPVIKHTKDGETFSCFTSHLDGEGLIQITSSSARTANQRIYRFDRHGGLKGVFDVHADGADWLVYDRDSGFGRKKRHNIEQDSSAMIARLEMTLSEAEEMAFYL